jgi:RNA polymerase sigma-70 factor (ECF subfamily)
MSGDPAVGEELAQEALTSLVRYWRCSGPPDSPSAFTFTVARRAFRRTRWRQRILLPLEFLVDGHQPDPSPQEVACQRGELVETLAALKRLPPRDRQAILLAVTGDHGVHEASRILGISASAFKMRVHRARQRLSRFLEGNHEKR